MQLTLSGVWLGHFCGSLHKLYVAQVEDGGRGADDLVLVFLAQVHRIHGLEDLLPVRPVISPIHSRLKI